MRLGYRTQGLVLGDGERYCLLVDPGTGMPLFYPNLFVTTQVRNRSLSAASMNAASAAINVLLTYCSERGINLESRIRERRFFSPAELDRRIAQSRLALRVAVTRAIRRATIVTPQRDSCPFL